MSDSIKVAIRLRPFIQRETTDREHKNRWLCQNNSICQVDDRGITAASYTFDRVFDGGDTTADIYEEIVSPIVLAAMEGFNGTVFAYGQTSSGKTFTMGGSKLQPGVVPCAIEDSFERIQYTPDREFLMRTSYLEIYNEKLSDLLSTEDKPLKIQLDQHNQLTVLNLTERIVTSPEEALEILKEGNARKRVGETVQNDRSSRSHCIFRMIIESRERNDDRRRTIEQAVMVSHLNFVDLAGSEKAGENSGERFKEGCAINKSLLCLSNVISKLSEGTGGQEFINYRDSKLTRILQNALGGNSKTAIICTATPASVEETHSTLRFASRAKAIKNKPLVNEVLSEAALLKRYKKEIDRLKKQLTEQEIVAQQPSKDTDLLQQLEEKEKLQREQQSEIERLKKFFCVSTLPNPDSCPVPFKKMRRETWCPGRRRASLAPGLPGMLSENRSQFDGDNLNLSISDRVRGRGFDILSIPEENDFEVSLTTEMPISPFRVEVACQTDQVQQEQQEEKEDSIPKHLQVQLEQSMNICDKLISERDFLELELHEAKETIAAMSDKITLLQNHLTTATSELGKREAEFIELEEFTRLEKDFQTPKSKKSRRVSGDMDNVLKLQDEIINQQKNASDAEGVTMETRKALSQSQDYSNELEKELAETKKKLSQLSKEKIDFDCLIEHEKEKNERLQKELRIELLTAYEEISQLKSSSPALRKNDPLLNRLQELSEKVGTLDVSTIVSEREDLKVQLAEARVAAQSAAEECQSKENECCRLISKQTDLKENLVELASDLSDSQDENLRLTEELGDSKEKLILSEDKLMGLQAKLDELCSETETIRAEKNCLQQEIQNVQELIEEKERILEEVNLDFEIIREELSLTKEELSHLKTGENEQQRLQDLLLKEQTLEEINPSFERTKQELEELKAMNQRQIQELSEKNAQLLESNANIEDLTIKVDNLQKLSVHAQGTLKNTDKVFKDQSANTSITEPPMDKGELSVHAQGTLKNTDKVFKDQSANTSITVPPMDEEELSVHAQGTLKNTDKVFKDQSANTSITEPPMDEGELSVHAQGTLKNTDKVFKDQSANTSITVPPMDGGAPDLNNVNKKLEQELSEKNIAIEETNAKIIELTVCTNMELEAKEDKLSSLLAKYNDLTEKYNLLLSKTASNAEEKSAGSVNSETELQHLSTKAIVLVKPLKSPGGSKRRTVRFKEDCEEILGPCIIEEDITESTEPGSDFLFSEETGSESPVYPSETSEELEECSVRLNSVCETPCRKDLGLQSSSNRLSVHETENQVPLSEKQDLESNEKDVDISIDVDANRCVLEYSVETQQKPVNNTNILKDISTLEMLCDQQKAELKEISSLLEIRNKELQEYKQTNSELEALLADKGGILTFEGNDQQVKISNLLDQIKQYKEKICDFENKNYGNEDESFALSHQKATDALHSDLEYAKAELQVKQAEIDSLQSLVKAQHNVDNCSDNIVDTSSDLTRPQVQSDGDNTEQMNSADELEPNAILKMEIEEDQSSEKVLQERSENSEIEQPKLSYETSKLSQQDINGHQNTIDKQREEISLLKLTLQQTSAELSKSQKELLQITTKMANTAPVTPTEEIEGNLIAGLPDQSLVSEGEEMPVEICEATERPNSDVKVYENDTDISFLDNSMKCEEKCDKSKLDQSVEESRGKDSSLEPASMDENIHAPKSQIDTKESEVENFKSKLQTLTALEKQNNMQQEQLIKLKAELERINQELQDRNKDLEKQLIQKELLLAENQALAILRQTVQGQQEELSNVRQELINVTNAESNSENFNSKLMAIDCDLVEGAVRSHQVETHVLSNVVNEEDQYLFDCQLNSFSTNLLENNKDIETTFSEETTAEQFNVENEVLSEALKLKEQEIIASKSNIESMKSELEDALSRIVELQAKDNEIDSLKDTVNKQCEDLQTVSQKLQAKDQELIGNQFYIQSLKAELDAAYSKDVVDRAVGSDSTDDSSVVIASLKMELSDKETALEEVKVDSRQEELGNIQSHVQELDSNLQLQLSTKENLEDSIKKLSSNLEEKVLASERSQAELLETCDKLSTLRAEYEHLDLNFKTKVAELTVELAAQQKEVLIKDNVTEELKVKLAEAHEMFDHLKKEHEEAQSKHIGVLEKAESDLIESQKTVQFLQHETAQKSDLEKDILNNLESDIIKKSSSLQLAEQNLQESLNKQTELYEQYEQLLSKHSALEELHKELSESLQKSEESKIHLSDSQENTLAVLQEKHSFAMGELKSVKKLLTEVRLKEDSSRKAEKEADKKLLEYEIKFSQLTEKCTSLESNVLELKERIECVEMEKCKAIEDCSLAVNRLKGDCNSQENTLAVLQEKYSFAMGEIEDVKKLLTEAKLKEDCSRKAETEADKKLLEYEIKFSQLTEKCTSLESNVLELKERIECVEMEKCKAIEDCSLAVNRLKGDCNSQENTLAVLQEKYSFALGEIEDVKKLLTEAKLKEDCSRKAEKEADKKLLEYEIKFSQLTEKCTSLESNVLELKERIECVEMEKYKAIEDCSLAVNRLKGDCNSQENTLAVLQEKYSFAMGEIEDVKKLLTEAKLKEDCSRKAEKEADKKLLEYEIKFSQLTEKCTSLESNVLELKERIECVEMEKYKAIEDCSLAVNRLKGDCNSQENTLAVLQEKYSFAMGEIEDVKKLLTEAKLKEDCSRKAEKEADKKLLEYQIKSSQLTEKCTSLESNVLELKERIECVELEKRKAIEDCRLAQVRLESSSADNAILPLKNLISDIQAQSSEYQANVMSVTREKYLLQSHLESMKKELEGTKSQMTVMQEEMKIKTDEKNEAQRQLSVLTTILDDLTQSRNKLQLELHEARQEPSRSTEYCNDLNDSMVSEQLTAPLIESNASGINWKIERMKLYRECRKLQADVDRWKKANTVRAELQENAEKTTAEQKQQIEELKVKLTQLSNKSSLSLTLEDPASGDKELITKNVIKKMEQKRKQIEVKLSSMKQTLHQKGVQVEVLAEECKRLQGEIASKDEFIKELKENSPSEPVSAEEISALKKELAQKNICVVGLQNDLQVLQTQFETKVVSLTETVDEKNQQIKVFKQEMRRMNARISADDTICYLKPNDQKAISVSPSTSPSHTAPPSTVNEDMDNLHAGRSGIVDTLSVYMLQADKSRLEKENNKLKRKLDSYEKQIKLKRLNSASRADESNDNKSTTQEALVQETKKTPIKLEAATVKPNLGVEDASYSCTKLESSSSKVKEETENHDPMSEANTAAGADLSNLGDLIRQKTTIPESSMNILFSDSKETSTRATRRRTQAQAKQEEQCKQQ